MPNARYDTEIPANPNEPLPFEILPEIKFGPRANISPDEMRLGGRAKAEYDWAFAPEYYPDRFPQSKEKKLDRSGKQCSGEDVAIESIKNREFHVSGVLLAREVSDFNQMLDYDGVVDLYSPISPSGGMQCYVKNGEISATPEGFDAIHRMWRFEYSIDLVSTGNDEYDRTKNAIVSSIISTSGDKSTENDESIISSIIGTSEDK
jgi:hypothetical protein